MAFFLVMLYYMLLHVVDYYLHETNKHGKLFLGFS